MAEGGGTLRSLLLKQRLFPPSTSLHPSWLHTLPRMLSLALCQLYPSMVCFYWSRSAQSTAYLRHVHVWNVTCLHVLVHLYIHIRISICSTHVCAVHMSMCCTHVYMQYTCLCAVHMSVCCTHVHVLYTCLCAVHMSMCCTHVHVLYTCPCAVHMYTCVCSCVST